MSDAVATDAAPSEGRSSRLDRPEPSSLVMPRHPLLQRLGFRMSALLAVALLPLGTISLFQGNAWLEAAREQRVTALMGETLVGSAPLAGLIREAQGATTALAQTLGPLSADEEVCDAALTALAGASPQYSVAGFVPLNGNMTCAADGAAYDYSGNPIFEELIRDLRPRLMVIPVGPVSGTSIVLVVHPVLDEQDERPLGYVALALPHAALSGGPPRETASGLRGESPDFVTFNREGEVLTASTGLERAAEILPEGVALDEPAQGGQSSFTARTAAGEERIYAIVPLIDGELFALGSVTAREAARLGPVSLLTPFVLAGLMWMVSLAAAWIAAEHLVTRYIRRLGRAIRAFASGSRVVGDLDMDGAPAELREVGRAFLRMTDTILHDEAELEDTVHQREVLLREVHHRVKNNLQLIASIMNMQMRRARSPETKALMKGLQDRVMSLATVHKELYQTSGLTDVRADELLSDITRQIVGLASAPGRSFQIAIDFDSIPLTPDQAVPLSLLLTEALTNSLKYAEPAPGEAAPALDLRFAAQEGGRAELSISNTAGPARPGPPGEGTGLGRQLVSAFASQLGGEVVTLAENGRFVLRVAFPLSRIRGEGPRTGS